MEIKEIDNQIIIHLSEDLIENNISSLKEELLKFEFDNRINNYKELDKKIVIDTSEVNNVDFFGYQHIYGFCYYIKKKLLFSNLSVINKSNQLLEFEKKYGLKI